MTELLSPAGNWDCARAAVAAGADAIYFGLPAFNARLRADNFTEEDLPELMDYLHKHGVKGFVAMNTLIFTDELEAAERQLRLVAAAGVDALIIQDLGLAKMARLIAPEVELHASTQMTITSPEGLAFLESIFPMERAVLARELSLKEIERFHSNPLITDHPAPITPLEVFVHGALCVAYSGQCLTSESLGQRSANRGECAQACRMPYEIVVDGETRDLGEHRYLLSPQDLAAVDLIPELVAAGVKSFKIEGRLKTPEYVAAVTRVYRKALDAVAASVPAQAVQTPSRGVSQEDKYELEMTFSRGLTTGWLAGTNHPYLTHGKFGKKRGPFLGTIIEAQNGWIRLDTPPSEQTPPLKAGDGIVFDAGENRDLEQGASIWKIENDRIIFHRTYSGINFNRIRPGITLYKTADPALESSIRKFWQTAKPNLKKSPLHLTITGQPGEPLTLSTDTTSVSTAIQISEASTRPLSTETLTQQLSKLGDTPYELASLENQLTGNCHLPISALNQARRDLVAAVSNRQAETQPKPSPSSTTTETLFPSTFNVERSTFDVQLSVLTRTPSQVTAALEAGIPRIYCDFEDPRRYKEAVALADGIPSKIILATPRIIKPGETGYLKLIERAEPAGLLLRNLHALQHFKNHTHLERTGDFSLNVANPLTAKILMESAALDRLTISYDLNISQVINLISQTPPEWLELTLHQHMPMFHMEHCVFCTFLSSGTTYKDCGRPCEKHVVHLRDRVGQLHRLQADVGCRNTLFNGRAQTGARFFKSLLDSGLRNYRIELLDEEHADAYSTIRAYQELLEERITPENLLTRIHATEKLGVTEGTLA
ncbi:MAG: U32 family peptidase [Akkermansiaceae bacterium]|nr:U32 family peptidase [Akkermansiaceae bacterium]MDP4646916.1 U32 family peptidase [Akkermansiaceae bacterium]MDP4722352.1 U32 family peptidase [Akkermansiaceae bacterium]MDP4781248.1 U32 family peptidase [Akkermansiaceae bacterium]MDP4847876.1 U32 family peptidase [Akkermansiaceae bacterium]